MALEIEKIKCPQCLNYIITKRTEKGSYKGSCSVCKAIIYTRQVTPKEKSIKIINT